MRRGMHPATVGTYITKGDRMPDGSRLKLRAVRVGSKWMTTYEWIDQFIETRTAAFVGRADTPAPRSPSETLRAAEHASAELARMGA